MEWGQWSSCSRYILKLAASPHEAAVSLAPFYSSLVWPHSPIPPFPELGAAMPQLWSCHWRVLLSTSSLLMESGTTKMTWYVGGSPCNSAEMMPPSLSLSPPAKGQRPIWRSQQCAEHTTSFTASILTCYHDYRCVCVCLLSWLVFSVACHNHALFIAVFTVFKHGKTMTVYLQSNHDNNCTYIKILATIINKEMKIQQ